jgi:hypothetical protein
MKITAVCIESNTKTLNTICRHHEGFYGFKQLVDVTSTVFLLSFFLSILVSLTYSFYL